MKQTKPPGVTESAGEQERLLSSVTGFVRRCASTPVSKRWASAVRAFISLSLSGARLSSIARTACGWRESHPRTKSLICSDLRPSCYTLLFIFRPCPTAREQQFAWTRVKPVLVSHFIRGGSGPRRPNRFAGSLFRFRPSVAAGRRSTPSGGPAPSVPSQSSGPGVLASGSRFAGERDCSVI